MTIMVTDDEAVTISRLVEAEAEAVLRHWLGRSHAGEHRLGQLHGVDDPWALAVLIAAAVRERLQQAIAASGPADSPPDTSGPADQIEESLPEGWGEIII